MKRNILVILGLLLTLPVTATRAAPEDYETDFAKATKTAAEKKLPILAVFEGSDWCSWCQKLDKEILSQDEFKKFAKDNVVLFVADFPNSKPVKEDVLKQNTTLAEKYGVQGFPTVLLLDSQGKVLARTGYKQGGASAYVQHIKTLIKG